MSRFYFRLTNNLDPEERLEEAALWKAFSDRFGEEISAVCSDFDATGENVFGRPRRADRVPMLKYWSDPAFLENCGRKFEVMAFEDVGRAVSKLHASGQGAFLKSTRDKHWIARVPVGTDWREVMDDMAYSFMDGGPQIMVQELCDIKYEWRFFTIGRKIVTDSPNAVHLTPLDFPCGVAFHKPSSPLPMCNGELLRDEMMMLAQKIAHTMGSEDAVIDLATINGKIGCVELNPMIIGGVGLFASDVRAIADAVYQSALRERNGR